MTIKTTFLPSALCKLLAPGLLMLSAGAQARPAEKPVTALVAPAMWQVKDADTTIYLFGTVHVLKPGIDWFKGGVRKAFDSSDQLVLEIIGPDNPHEMAGTMAQMAQMAMARDGIKLSDRLSPQAQASYRAAMESNSLPWQTFEMFNPWMAGMVLAIAPLERLGYRNELGAEKILRAAAQEAGKSVIALETVEQQVSFFANLPMEQQVAFLNATVDGLPDMDSQLASLFGHWQAGDPETLGEEINESLKATPELARIVLTDRNASWAQWIKARLDQPGTVFLAVGAGHLAGEGSVQAQLEALGIKSARVKGE